MTAVFDTSVVASAVFWHNSTARRCLIGLARRKFTLVITDEIEHEYAATCSVLRPRKPQQDPAGPLAWILSRALRVAHLPLGKPRSRDPKDDIFLAAALAGGAEF
jgi:predicted nucleic acid-binding protein